MSREINIVEIDGEPYVTKKDFCFLLNRSEQGITQLITKGNSFRKLKHKHMGASVFIPFSEVTEFPFVLPGRGCRYVQYTKEGDIDWERSDIGPENPLAQ